MSYFQSCLNNRHIYGEEFLLMTEIIGSIPLTRNGVCMENILPKRRPVLNQSDEFQRLVCIRGHFEKKLLLQALTLQKKDSWDVPPQPKNIASHLFLGRQTPLEL
eukprot:TRINITY_DN68561_c0_g1_i1.p2 TRINITY_DN68561_c0_g1~~TRINITY_DN68561_c0_g1_i1.p2  ORF type:complete len:105 (-),score=8.33 TRINITY_DN68561_c0_g1_i1:495-809(-)